LGLKLEYFQKHGNQGLEVGNRDIKWTMFLKSIFEMLNTYMNGSLIYESVSIALVRENGGAMGVRSGINKMQVETNQCEIYMNRKHMVAESEVNKRQDFTINGNRVGN